jgi:hypothetical protein
MFLNVPKEIEDQIMSMPSEDYLDTFRGIRHFGPFSSNDFLPSFVDQAQKMAREKIASKGPLGHALSSFKNKFCPTDYSVSLFSSLDSIKGKLWATKSGKAAFPIIAEGKTDPQKGRTIIDCNFHVSYYLFDYVNNSPVGDFHSVEAKL